MKSPKNRDYRQAVLSLLVSLVLTLSLVPSAAIAQVLPADTQVPGGAQSSIQTLSQSGSNAGASQLSVATSGLTAQADAEDPHDIDVTVGLASESNVKKDLYAQWADSSSGGDGKNNPPAKDSSKPVASKLPSTGDPLMPTLVALLAIAMVSAVALRLARSGRRR